MRRKVKPITLKQLIIKLERIDSKLRLENDAKNLFLDGYAIPTKFNGSFEYTGILNLEYDILKNKTNGNDYVKARPTVHKFLEYAKSIIGKSLRNENFEEVDEDMEIFISNPIVQRKVILEKIIEHEYHVTLKTRELNDIEWDFLFK